MLAKWKKENNLIIICLGAAFLTFYGAVFPLLAETETILSFEAGSPAAEFTAAAGTEEPDLPHTLRAVVALEEEDTEWQEGQTKPEPDPATESETEGQTDETEEQGSETEEADHTPAGPEESDSGPIESEEQSGEATGSEEQSGEPDSTPARPEESDSGLIESEEQSGEATGPEEQSGEPAELKEPDSTPAGTAESDSESIEPGSAPPIKLVKITNPGEQPMSAKLTKTAAFHGQPTSLELTNTTDIKPQQPFVPAVPEDTHGYQSAEGDLYTYSDQYRTYGSLNGGVPAWYACDENGNINGVVMEIPVTWTSGDYDKNTPGTYTFTAQFSGYSYAGTPPYALVTVEEEGNSISGRLWLDENADGVMDIGENGIAGYPVALYGADDLNTAVQAVATEPDGTYRFENMEPGSYVVRVTSEIIDETEYLLPLTIENNNKFAMDEESAASWSAPLEIAEDTAICGIDAGLRLPEGIRPLAEIWIFDFSDLVMLIDNDLLHSGDTIIIFDGVTDVEFTNSLTINMDLTFKAAGSAPVTFTSRSQRHFIIPENSNVTLNFENIVLDGGGTGGGIEVRNGAAFTLMGVAIQNCYAATGGGIQTATGSTVAVTGSKISDNSTSGNGGGIYVPPGGTINVSNCEIIGNKTASYGGGIYAGNVRNTTPGVTVTISNSTISNNKAKYAAAGVFCGTDTSPADLKSILTITSSTISNNVAEGSCGGIWAMGCDFTLEGGEITDNRAAGYQGGGIIVSEGIALIKNSTISNNSAGTSGGGIFANECSVTIDNSKLTAENAAQSGGGIHASFSALIVQNGSEISGNKASLSGGGIYGSNANITIDRSAVSGNQANNGGGIYSTGSITIGGNSSITGNKALSAHGGGVYADGGTFTMESGKISNNTAVSGDGGGVYSFKSTFTMEGGEVMGNTAVKGGGVFAYRNPFIMEGGTISGNEATDSGGGVFVDSATFTMRAGKISDNTAAISGGGVFVPNNSTFIMEDGEVSNNNAGDGGGVYVAQANGLFQMKSGKISGNRATAKGGGVYAYYSSTFTMEGGEVSKNNAGDGGGICGQSSARITIDGSMVSGNTANNQGGGVYIASGTLTVQNGSEVSLNTTVARDGGGIYGRDSAQIIVDGSTISRNKSGQYGGGLHGYSTKITIQGSSTVSGNSSSQYGGGIYVFGGTLAVQDGSKMINNMANADGGGIYGEQSAQITIDGSTISDNQAIQYGGGVCVRYGSKIIINNNSTITRNKAIRGGGIYGSELVEITVNDSTITSNTATYGGGVWLWSTGAFTVNRSKISGNTATKDGGGIYGEYYGLVGEVITRITIEDSTISGNTADTNGGGIYLSGIITIDGTSGITGNKAPNGHGGGIYVTDLTKLSVSSAVTFIGNTASVSAEPLPDMTVQYSQIATISSSVYNHPLNNYDINVLIVKVHYIDGKGNPVGGLPNANYAAVSGASFTLPAEKIPPVSGYVFTDWKVGTNGVRQGNTTVQLPNVAVNTDIYLIYERVSVTVSKEVSGAYADKTRDFTFTIKFADNSGTPLASGTRLAYTGGIIPGSGAPVPAGGTLTLDSGGKATFTLRHGQTITIAEVPADGRVWITEADVTGYTASWRDGALSPGIGTFTDELIMSGMDKTVAFTNTYGDIVPTGIWTDNARPALLLALFAGVPILLITGGLMCRRRQKGVMN